MNEEKLIKSLAKLGFADKEAKVYLASLKLGPAPVQAIAKEAKVVRPTAYVMIESLERRGLMSTFQKGKRRLFVAGRPDRLRYLVAQEKTALGKRETAVKRAIEELTDKKKKDEIEFEIIEGTEGTRRLQQMALETDNPIREAVNLEKVRKFIPPQFEGDVRKKINKRQKVLGVAQESENHKWGGSRPSRPGRELDAEVIIIDDTVFLSIFGDEQKTLRVKNAAIAKSLSAMFDALYEESPLSQEERKSSSLS